MGFSKRQATAGITKKGGGVSRRVPGIHVTGSEELRKALEGMKVTTQKKHLRKGLTKVAKMVQQDAKRLAPVNTGWLESSIKSRAIKRTRKAVGRRIGIFDDGPFYARFVELGTKRSRADAFLRPALFGNITGVMSALTRAVLDSIQETARKAKQK